MRGAAGRTGLGLVLALVVTAASLVLATPAAAHVSVHADEAVPGSTARVVFRVPNEGETPTTQLQVQLSPEGAPPIPSATTAAMPGWSVEVEYRELDQPVQGAHGEELTQAVATVTWTAQDEDAGIQPGQFGEFPIMIGPLPEAEELYFPTLQTYAGIDEPVRWISPPEPGGSEPPDPAPVLRLTGAEDAEGGSSAPSADGPDEPSGDTADAGTGGDGAPVWLSLAALVAGLAGLALGGAAFARTATRAAGPRATDQGNDG